LLSVFFCLAFARSINNKGFQHDGWDQDKTNYRLVEIRFLLLMSEQVPATTALVFLKLVVSAYSKLTPRVIVFGY
jgi:hypothetical protein